MKFRQEKIKIEATPTEVYNLLSRNIESDEISLLRNKKELDKSEQIFVGNINKSDFKLCRNKKNSYFHPPALLCGNLTEKDNGTEMVLKYCLSKLTILVAAVFILFGITHSLLQVSSQQQNFQQLGSYLTLFLFVIAAVYIIVSNEKQQLKKELKSLLENMNTE